ncbi:MAG: aminotransferase class IV [Proteobacteria bacterium]|nr:aminotransferase class IV [Pseudomonadota bacterium]
MGERERTIWVDGELRPWPEATLHVLSQTAQRGTLIFDTLPVFAGPDGPRALGLAEHVRRFFESARLIDMELTAGFDEVIAGIGSTLRANRGAEVVKLSGYYPGISPDLLPIDRHASVAIAAYARADLELEGQARPSRPARLRIADAPKLPSSVLSPQLKIAAGYTRAAVETRRARAEGFDDVLFLDLEGQLAESSTQSFFAVLDDALWTAPDGTVLAGVTRRVVIDLARAAGIEVRQRALRARELESTREAFLTGTTIGVWPVALIGSRAYPDPLPGPVTARLAAHFERLVRGEDRELSERWLQAV